MSIHIMMSDGKKDQWGSKYMKSVYKDRGEFRQAIATLTRIIDSLEHYQERLGPLASDTQSLWDDYWHTERLIEGLESCAEDYARVLGKLTIARDNLDILVKAAEYYKAHKWGEKSDADKVGDGLKAIFTLGASGSMSSERDVHYNC